VGKEVSQRAIDGDREETCRREEASYYTGTATSKLANRIKVFKF
jgi:hypothetical protein